LNAPPFVFQALLKAQANTLERALGFLTRAAAAAPAVNEDGAVFVYDPVPMSLFRLMDVERGQLLVESASRSALHRFLKRWTGQMASETGVAWRIEVDPQEV
jgi:primosomal protein N' (replication factor Y) (superfamily II helicase)